MPRRVARRVRVLEGTIERQHVSEVEAEGWIAWKLNGLGRAARPDRLYLGPGGDVALIEWKRPGQVPTPLQADTLDELEIMGHRVAACDSLSQARVFLNSVTENSRVRAWRLRWEDEHPDGEPLPPVKTRGFKRA